MQGPAQATFLASKCSVRVVVVGQTCFNIRLQNYWSDLTMFRFNLLDVKCLSDVYTHYFTLQFIVISVFTVLFIVIVSDYIATMYVAV